MVSKFKYVKPTWPARHCKNLLKNKFKDFSFRMKEKQVNVAFFWGVFCFYALRCVRLSNRKLCVLPPCYLTLTIEGKRSRRAKDGDFEQSAEIQRENRFT